MVINLMSVCRAMSHLTFPSILTGVRNTASLVLVKEQNVIVIAVSFKIKTDNTSPMLSVKMKM